MLRTSQEALLLRGIEEFNAGDYFECHETLEELWNELDGPEKRAVQGLLQAAVGLLHAGRGNYLGAAKLLRDGIAKLEDGAAGTVLGLELRGFLDGLRACHARAETLLREGGEWDPETDVRPLPRPGGIPASPGESA